MYFVLLILPVLFIIRQTFTMKNADGKLRAGYLIVSILPSLGYIFVYMRLRGTSKSCTVESGFFPYTERYQA